MVYVFLDHFLGSSICVIAVLDLCLLQIDQESLLCLVIAITKQNTSLLTARKFTSNVSLVFLTLATDLLLV